MSVVTALMSRAGVRSVLRVDDGDNWAAVREVCADNGLHPRRAPHVPIFCY